MKRDIINELKNDRFFLPGFIMLAFWIIISAAGPFILSANPWDMSFRPFALPSAEHLLGINDGGQDIFSELIYAVRNSVLFGFLAGSTALVIGVIAGASSALVGGIYDAVVTKICDIILAVPLIMILIMVAAFLQPHPAVLALILGSLVWPTIARSIRAQTLALKQQLYVRAAAQMGGGYAYVLRRHILPEIFPLFIIGFAARMRMAIFMEASLAFLGLMDPSHKSLGLMINYALRFYYEDVWWNWIMPPILCLSLIIISVTFVATGMERIFDPKQDEITG